MKGPPRKGFHDAHRASSLLFTALYRSSYVRGDYYCCDDSEWCMVGEFLSLEATFPSSSSCSYVYVYTVISSTCHVDTPTSSLRGYV